MSHKVHKNITEQSPDYGSTLLHFLHPYALDNFVFFLKNITRLRGYLASRMKEGDHIQLAREVLVDALTSSCVDLASLCEALEEIQAEVNLFAGTHSLSSERKLPQFSHRLAPGANSKVSSIAQASLPNRDPHAKSRRSLIPAEIDR